MLQKYHLGIHFISLFVQFQHYCRQIVSLKYLLIDLACFFI
jgi:hypothetical protein